MTTPQIDTAPLPPPLVGDDAPQAALLTAERVSDLLIALERAAPRAPTLTPMADLRPAHDGTGDLFVFATVFVGLDLAPPQPFALHEVRLAADCLDADPPFPAAPSLAPALRAAVAQAAAAALSLQRSLG